MIEVHLIGYTADLRHLVLDVDANEERGRYRLVVDGDLFATLDDMRVQRWEQGLDVGVWEPGEDEVWLVDEDLVDEGMVDEGLVDEDEDEDEDTADVEVVLDEEAWEDESNDLELADDDLAIALLESADHEPEAIEPEAIESAEPAGADPGQVASDDWDDADDWAPEEEDDLLLDLADDTSAFAELEDEAPAPASGIRPLDEEPADLASLGLTEDDEEIDELLDQLASPTTQPLPTVVIVPAPEPEPVDESVASEEPVEASAAHEDPVFDEEATAHEDPVSDEEPVSYEEPVLYEEPVAFDEPAESFESSESFEPSDPIVLDKPEVRIVPAPAPTGPARLDVAPYPPIRPPVGGGMPDAGAAEASGHRANGTSGANGSNGSSDRLRDSDVPGPAALPSARRRRLDPDGMQVPTDAALTPAQIQAELRGGASIKAVARKAGTSEAWVQRWMEPIQAERERIIDQARTLPVATSRGRSAAPLGRSVSIRLRKRRVDPATASWDAARRADGSWRVSCRFTEKGKSRTASWVFARGTDTLKPASDLARQIGWVDRKLVGSR